jgi:hypothetical protein
MQPSTRKRLSDLAESFWEHKKVTKMLTLFSRTARLSTLGAIESIHSRRAIMLSSWLALIALFFLGCATKEEDHTHSHIVYHHRPENFKLAVLRLDEMHRILTGPDSLPPVKTFADLSHSREHNDDDENSHHQTHQDELISVGIFQEYFDIVRWLPTIAADNDLPKSEWDPINESCKELSRLVQQIESELKSADSNKQSADNRMRTLYRDRTKSFETAISELQAKLSVFDAWQKKVVN